MGIVRLLLALSILLFHTGALFGYIIVDQNTALTSFFIISGFYMALILDTKYRSSHTSFSVFITNRFLRIYPLYWCVLLLTFFLTCIKFFLLGTDTDNAISHYIQYSHHQTPVIFTLALINFILRNTTLLITSDYILKSDNTPGYLLVQQAWTLQLELLLYLMAPFLVRLKQIPFLVFFVVYVLSVFYFLIPNQIVENPSLMYSFFVYGFYFLSGIASYTYIYQYIEQKKFPAFVTSLSFVVIVGYILGYSFIPFRLPLEKLSIADICYFSVFTILLPFVFKASKTWKWDRWLGEFSYPVYITHFFIIKLLANISLTGVNDELKRILVILVTFFVSYLAIVFLLRPIDQYRQKRLKKSSHQLLTQT